MNPSTSKPQNNKKNSLNSDYITMSESSLNSSSINSIEKSNHININCLTHNYKYDISGYKCNTLFQCGLYLQMLVFITENHQNIPEYSNKSNINNTKYFNRRKVFFSKFNEGVKVDS